MHFFVYSDQTRCPSRAFSKLWIGVLNLLVSTRYQAFLLKNIFIWMMSYTDNRGFLVINNPFSNRTVAKAILSSNVAQGRSFTLIKSG